MVRIAVIGIGNMGRAHAVNLFKGEVEGATLTCVCDTDKEKIEWAKETFKEKVAYFDDYKEMFKTNLFDLVLIATPHYDHPTIAIDAFKAGFHVLTEKPAGVDVESVRKMNLYSLVSGKTFSIMYNQRTDSLFQTLKYYIDLGVLGEIKRTVWIINNWYRTQHYYDSATWRASWNGEGGGALINQCPHNLDIWQWIMGMPDKISAHCNEGLFHKIGVEDDATIYAEYKNGASAVFITSTGEYPGTNRLEISGTMGKAVAEDGVLKLFLLDENEEKIRFESNESMPTEKVTPITISFKEEKDGHILLLQNVVNHIEKGEELIAPGVEGIRGLTISNAAYLSAWTKKEVKLPFNEKKFNRYLNKKKTLELLGGKKRNRKSEEKYEDNGEYSARWKVRW